MGHAVALVDGPDLREDEAQLEQVPAIKGLALKRDSLAHGLIHPAEALTQVLVLSEKLHSVNDEGHFAVIGRTIGLHFPEFGTQAGGIALSLHRVPGYVVFLEGHKKPVQDLDGFVLE